MRKTFTMALAVVAAGGVLALGFAVAALGSSTSSAALASTSETTTTPTSTTEQGKATPYAATLGARAEVPKATGVSSGAGGSFSVTLTDKGGSYTATWKLAFHALTGKAVAAHIHQGKPGKAGPVLVSLCGPCKSGAHGSAKVSAAAAKAIKSGSAYVNVHTAKNANGEIRGQVKKK